jgi:hypothetical protein
MKMNHRGITYNYTPPTVENKIGELAGRYRGLDWRFCNPTKIYTQQASVDLMRQTAAHHPQDSSELPESSLSYADSTSDMARYLVLNRQRTIKQRQQTLITRVAMEVGLASQQASHYWNHIQGKLHPSFRLNYDRGGATMS